MVGFPAPGQWDRVYVRRVTLIYNESLHFCRIDKTSLNEKSESIGVDSDVVFKVFHSPLVSGYVLYGKLKSWARSSEYKPISVDPDDWIAC